MTRCLIPFCRRTTRKPYHQWVCREHWMALPKGMRRVWARLKRDVEREWDAASEARRDVLYLRCERLWRRIVKAAVGRAGESPL